METIFHGQSAAFLPLQLPPDYPCHQKPQGSSCCEYVQTKEAVTIATTQLCARALLLTLASLPLHSSFSLCAPVQTALGQNW